MTPVLAGRGYNLLCVYAYVYAAVCANTHGGANISARKLTDDRPLA